MTLIALAVYGAAKARGATVVVPPKRTAVGCSRSYDQETEQDRSPAVEEGGGHHQQARVENGFFRYKSIIGDGLRARTPAGQATEAVLACTILTRMTELGRPESYRISS